jgi:hypothetical protein
MTIRRWVDFSRLHCAILRLGALLVPERERPEWIAEWKSELWYVLRRRNGSLDTSRLDWDALRYCLGAFRDAAWHRRNSSDPTPRQFFWLRSPLRCVVFLAILAAVAAFFFFRPPGPCDGILRAARPHPESVLAHILMVAIALLILPATTSLRLGEYPAAPGSPARAGRFRRGTFLGLKFALVLPIVFCGTLDLAPVISSACLQPHATLVGYVLAFRWALMDQRRRCPVCLRRLAGPARIGQASQTFLEWYGTELFCVKGHGLLHVPEIPTSYSVQRWLDLDTSWGSLFP